MCRGHRLDRECRVEVGDTSDDGDNSGRGRGGNSSGGGIGGGNSSDRGRIGSTGCRETSQLTDFVCKSTNGCSISFKLYNKLSRLNRLFWARTRTC